MTPPSVRQYDQYNAVNAIVARTSLGKSIMVSNILEDTGKDGSDDFATRQHEYSKDNYRTGEHDSEVFVS